MSKYPKSCLINNLYEEIMAHEKLSKIDGALDTANLMARCAILIERMRNIADRVDVEYFDSQGHSAGSAAKKLRDIADEFIKLLGLTNVID